MRIASLVPSTTEILFAVGAGADIVARSHECDFPAAAAQIPAVTANQIDDGLPSALIDLAGGTRDTHSIYALDIGALSAMGPDLVVTQSPCPICAEDAAAVEACEMPPHSRVLGSDPRTLDGVLASIIDVATAADKAVAGRALAARLRSRLHWVTSIVGELEAPRVAVLEWPDPIHAPGYWVPEMVEAAGGISVFGAAGERSRPATLDDLAAARPEVVVVAFCGFDLYQTQARFKELAADPVFARATRSARIFAVDGASYFSRPGPRLIDGIELLAWLLHRAHPRLRPSVGRAAELIEAGWVDASSIPLSVGS